MKKLKFILCIITMLLIGFSTVPDSAKAASTSTAIQLQNFPMGGTAYIQTSEDHYNVNATFTRAREQFTYVKLTLQRYDGSWKNIDTKSGYAGNGNGEKVNVTFSNISNVLEKSHRIKVEMYDGWNTSSLMETAYSDTWIR